jgi:hypothetical protein
LLIEPHLVDVADGNDIAKLPGLIDIATPLPPTPMPAMFNRSLDNLLNANPAFPATQ